MAKRSNKLLSGIEEQPLVTKSTMIAGNFVFLVGLLGNII